MAFKLASDLSSDLLKEIRKDTLNNRINYKGNYENYITGGSRALNNQAEFHDQDQDAVNIYQAKNGEVKNDYSNDPWIEGLNDRYTNPEHNRRAGASTDPNAAVNYIHENTPSTRRGRRASDIWFRARRNGVPATDKSLEQIQKIVNEYEGIKDKGEGLPF